MRETYTMLCEQSRSNVGYIVLFAFALESEIDRNRSRSRRGGNQGHHPKPRGVHYKEQPGAKCIAFPSAVLCCAVLCCPVLSCACFGYIVQSGGGVLVLGTQVGHAIPGLQPSAIPEVCVGGYMLVITTLRFVCLFLQTECRAAHFWEYCLLVRVGSFSETLPGMGRDL